MEALFLAKKVITFFIEPLGLILTLTFIGLCFLYKSSLTKAKIFLSFAFFSLLLLRYPPVGNLLLQQLESQYSKYDYKEIDISYIHVLGGGHHENEKWPFFRKKGQSSLTPSEAAWQLARSQSEIIRVLYARTKFHEIEFRLL